MFTSFVQAWQLSVPKGQRFFTDRNNFSPNPVNDHWLRRTFVPSHCQLYREPSGGDGCWRAPLQRCYRWVAAQTKYWLDQKRAVYSIKTRYLFHIWCGDYGKNCCPAVRLGTCRHYANGVTAVRLGESPPNSFSASSRGDLFFVIGVWGASTAKVNLRGGLFGVLERCWEWCNVICAWKGRHLLSCALWSPRRYPMIHGAL